MVKEKKEITLFEKIRKIHRSGLEEGMVISDNHIDLDGIETIDERVKKLFKLIDNKERNITNMLFFVMYDIESNKVRHQVSKYLLKNGCFRIQRSIFLADINTTLYEKIKSDLTEIQSFYDNCDSIIIVPVSTELIKAMKIIGKSIDVDVIMKTKNTIFF